MKNDKSVSVLNSLITINNDRIAGYETAIEEVKDTDLKSLFGQFVQDSRTFKSELIGEVDSLGGKPDEGTRTDGKIYRAWMDFKAMLTGKDRKAVLSSCEYGEDVAVNAYEKALQNKDLDTTQTSLLTSQYNKLKADHNKVRNLRDATIKV